MINMQYPDFEIRRGFLAGMLSDKAAIRAMAVQVVTGQVEAHLDMISDAGPEEYKTFQDVDRCIQGATESVKDYIEDMLAEFRDELYAQLANVRVETKAVLLKPLDEIDAEVDVTIV